MPIILMSALLATIGGKTPCRVEVGMLAERWRFVTAARVVFCETSQGKDLPAVRARRATAG